MTRRTWIGVVAGLLPLAFQQTAPVAPFRAAVDAVTIDVSVYQGNRPVGGLIAADFDLTDNGVTQQLTASSIETLPIDLTLVLDASGSVRDQFEQMRVDAQAVATLLKPDDRLRLITFATQVSETFGFVPGGSMPAIGVMRPGGATSYYHALVSALLAAMPSDRRQLIVGISDGWDTTSFLDAGDVRAAAARTDAVLYLFVVHYSGGVFETKPGGWVPYRSDSDDTLLRGAAVDTGGQLQKNFLANAVPPMVKSVLDEFRSSYVLRYMASGVAPGGWHDVVVRVTKPGKYAVRAKKGYFAGAGPGR